MTFDERQIQKISMHRENNISVVQEITQTALSEEKVADEKVKPYEEFEFSDSQEEKNRKLGNESEKNKGDRQNTLLLICLGFLLVIFGGMGGAFLHVEKERGKNEWKRELEELEWKRKINTKDALGETPLLYAARNSNPRYA